MTFSLLSMQFVAVSELYLASLSRASLLVFPLGFYKCDSFLDLFFQSTVAAPCRCLFATPYIYPSSTFYLFCLLKILRGKKILNFAARPLSSFDGVSYSHFLVV